MKKILIAMLLMVCGVMFSCKLASAQEMQEYTAHISDPEFQGIIEESMGNIVNARSTSRIIDWTVPSGKRYTTPYFSVSKGKDIAMVLTLSKSGKAGIINYEGYVRYVTGKEIDHVFSITETNSYVVFVQNLNSTSITADGGYAWN